MTEPTLTTSSRPGPICTRQILLENTKTDHHCREYVMFMPLTVSECALFIFVRCVTDVKLKIQTVGEIEKADKLAASTIFI